MPRLMIIRVLSVPFLAVLLLSACGAMQDPGPTTAEERPGVFDLPAAPMDLELVDGSSGYASLGDGRLIEFSRSSDGLDWTEIAAGLRFPRGIAVDADAVYVVEMGDLPCEPLYPSCPKVTPFDEIEILRESTGRVLRYPIQDEGVGPPSVLLDNLPVIGRDHAPNDIELGGDGLLYLSIGHVDFSWEHLELLEHGNLEWLGTVLRIDPDSGEVEVFAEGIRNVYGLAFARDGRLIGVDNDGPTYTGWREEELLAIESAQHYGYPDEGSLGPFEVRTGFPIYYLDSSGTAGIAAYRDGVIVGSCGELHYVPSLARSGYQRFDVISLGSVGGCVTSVAVRDDELLVGVFPGDGGSIQSLPLPPESE